MALTHVPQTPNTRPHLLWIDDEVVAASSGVRLLELEGFCVHCASTGVTGLAMASTGQYQGILLDLNLPDIPGLAVLTELRAQAIGTPVMVLTGFGDFESARAAGELGVRQFEAKPLLDLEIAVKQLVASPPSGGRHPYPQLAPLSAHSRARCTSLAAVLKGIHRLGRAESNEAEESAEGRDVRQMLAAALIQVLADPALPMLAFLACATSLRRTMAADRHSSQVALVRDVEQSILETLGRPSTSDPRAAAALEMVESEAAAGRRLTNESIAAVEHVGAAHLSGLIKAETGFRFTAWRSAFLLRPGLRLLVDTNEDIKQIACVALGYRHLSQFDRDFHRFFGVTPTRFRQICRGRD